MANAIGLKVEAQGTVGENPAMLRFQYEVLFIDESIGVIQSHSVFFDTNTDVTPQQFRAAFSAAILAKAAELFPAMTLQETDCVIDVMQRGN